MKTNKLFGLAVLACGFALSFTSCSNDDNPISGKKVVTISFENQTLNGKGFWCGDENGTEFDYWGSSAYACTYKEKGVTFNTNYIPSWGSWFGYAVSSRTETGFTMGDYTAEGMPDQFNNITGKAHSGKNFCVVQTYGEKIDIDATEGAVVKGFWYTNNSWTVDAILNGDGMTPGKFEKNDWLKCTVTDTKADNSTATVSFYLAENGSYAKNWKYADLRSLGKVKSLSFSFEGSKNNAGGLTTPAYMCIDDLAIEVEAED